MKQLGKRMAVALGLAAAAGLGWSVMERLADAGTVARGRGRNPAPVEVAAVERGAISLHRSFSGSLEARARFEVASKVGGRIEQLVVDVGDPVPCGQVVARIDNAELVQEVALAEAELAVAQASVAESRSRAQTASRALERATVLGERGVMAEAELDSSRTEREAASALLRVAEARVKRAQAALAGAQIRLDYTAVSAACSGSEQRVVAERFVEPGDTVSANTPLLSVVELAPIKAVVSVTARDYGRLRPGMLAQLQTDAYPNRSFEARTTRISPVFQEDSRQAWVELETPNTDRALKPGMFVRATLVLERADDAWIVPEAALTRRAEQDGVFGVEASGERALWRPVGVGIRDGGRVQVFPQGELGERVVTLGQQLLEDGSPISIRPSGGPPPQAARQESAGE